MPSVPSFCEAQAKQNEDGQGLFVFRFVAQFLGPGKVRVYSNRIGEAGNRGIPILAVSKPDTLVEFRFGLDGIGVGRWRLRTFILDS